jgi:quinol monooxygenase YgiN
MAGVVHVPFYATLFRGDKLEAALAELAPISLRYGATWYAVHRNRDDAYKILMMLQFESKSDWERFWNGPELIRFRAVNQSLYQVPQLYSWADISAEGRAGTGNGGNGGSHAPAPAPAPSAAPVA